MINETLKEKELMMMNRTLKDTNIFKDNRIN